MFYENCVRWLYRALPVACRLAVPFLDGRHPTLRFGGCSLRLPHMHVHPLGGDRLTTAECFAHVREMVETHNSELARVSQAAE